jgi:hypothetical protein
MRITKILLAAFSLVISLQACASAQAGHRTTHAESDNTFTLFDQAAEHAFTLEIPKTWQTNSGIARWGPQFSPWFTATSPDQQSGVFLGDPNKMYCHVPGPGFPNGKFFSGPLGNLRVMPYQTGVEFVQNFGQQMLPAGAQNVKLEGVKDEPEIAAKITEKMGNQATVVSVGTARYSFIQNGVPKISSVTMQVMRNAVGNWSEMNAQAYYAPPADESSVASIYSHARMSVKVNPQWMASESDRGAVQAQAVLKQQNDFGNAMLKQQADSSNRYLQTAHEQGMERLNAIGDRSRQQAQADADWHKNAMVNHYAQMAQKDNNNYHEVLMIQNKHLEYSPELQRNVEVPNY